MFSKCFTCIRDAIQKYHNQLKILKVRYINTNIKKNMTQILINAYILEIFSMYKDILVFFYDFQTKTSFSDKKSSGTTKLHPNFW